METNSLTSLGTAITAIVGYMGDIVTTITKAGNEIMLIPVAVFVIGAAIGLASRLIGR